MTVILSIKPSNFAYAAALSPVSILPHGKEATGPDAGSLVLVNAHSLVVPGM